MYQVNAPKNSAESSDWSDWWVLTIMNPWQCRRPSCISLEGVVLGGQLDSHDALWFFSCFIFMFDFQIHIYIYILYMYTVYSIGVHGGIHKIYPSPFPSPWDQIFRMEWWCIAWTILRERGPLPPTRPWRQPTPCHRWWERQHQLRIQVLCFGTKLVVFYTVPIQGKAMCSEDVVSCLWDLWWS